MNREENLEKEKRISEILELFPEKDKVDILDESESDKIESKVTDCFPIEFWGRIDWEKVNKKLFLLKKAY
ncbi:hypothetical protein CSE16_14095 [Solibacillus sp. R5-41]|uniref:hypothetical protein n=1 Tax=Solibacillus sp. R5-41 TaxID=2048654 RepID=UPI000C1281B3|nr:hypothetical protein [Solibacillus sp. R5-41]ATP41093.1 hypothetical protein CSE16_14095 [Solibacillus sp. R5-41]